MSLPAPLRPQADLNSDNGRQPSRPLLPASRPVLMRQRAPQQQLALDLRRR